MPPSLNDPVFVFTVQCFFSPCTSSHHHLLLRTRTPRHVRPPLPTNRAGELSTPPAAAPCPRATCLSPRLQSDESQTNDCTASQKLTIPPHLRSYFITAVSNVTFEDEAGEPRGKKRRKKKKQGSKTGQALIATYLGTDTLLFVPFLICLPQSPRKGLYSTLLSRIQMKSSPYNFHEEQAQNELKLALFELLLSINSDSTSHLLSTDRSGSNPTRLPCDVRPYYSSICSQSPQSAADSGNNLQERPTAKSSTVHKDPHRNQTAKNSANTSIHCSQSSPLFAPT